MSDMDSILMMTSTPAALVHSFISNQQLHKIGQHNKHYYIFVAILTYISIQGTDRRPTSSGQATPVRCQAAEQFNLAYFE